MHLLGFLLRLIVILHSKLLCAVAQQGHGGQDMWSLLKGRESTP